MFARLFGLIQKSRPMLLALGTGGVMLFSFIIPNWSNVKTMAIDLACLAVTATWCPASTPATTAPNLANLGVDAQLAISNDIRTQKGARCIASPVPMDLGQGLLISRGPRAEGRDVLVRYSTAPGCRVDHRGLIAASTAASIYRFRDNRWEAIRHYPEAATYFGSGPLVGWTKENVSTVVWFLPQQDMEILTNAETGPAWGFAWIGNRAFVTDGLVMSMHERVGDHLRSRSTDAPFDGALLRPEDREALRTVFHVIEVGRI